MSTSRSRSPLALRLGHVAAAVALGMVAAFTAGRALAGMVERVTSPGGIEAWHVPAPGSGLVTLRIAFKGGILQDPKARPGTAWLVAQMFRSGGAGALSAVELERRLEQLGVTLGMTANVGEMIVSLQTVTRHKAAAFELLASALGKPRFDEETVERVRRQSIDHLRNAELDPATMGELALLRRLYGAHRLSLPDAGTVESLKAITVDDMRDYRRRILARDTVKIAVTGDIAGQELAPVLDRLLDGLPARASLLSEDPPPPRKAERLHVEADIPQAQVYVGRAAPLLTEREKDVDVLMSRILNNLLTGRLWSELREKRGLVYWASAETHYSRIHARYVASFGAANETAELATRTMIAALQSFAQQGPTAGEFEAVKGAIAGQFLHGIETSADLAEFLISLQLKGRPIDALDRRIETLSSVTAQEIRDLARKLFDARDVTVVTVGRRPPRPAARKRSA